jgi:hypothetical protein
MKTSSIAGLHSRKLRTGYVIACLIAGVHHLSAQIAEEVYRSAYRIDSQHVNRLFVAIDNISFFKNNEYATVIVPGYTLPGFWLETKATYYPAKNMKLEGGVHSIWFWGAGKYPACAYSDLSRWNGDESAHVVHVLPYFRAQVALSKQVDIILGDLYGGANHNLIEPLYNPELNLTADPEAGLQLLWHTPRLDFDSWVDWTSFIYRSDTHQEVFTFGLSSRVKGNRPESRMHVYFPLQVLIQHRGGQIDATDLPVQTVLNGAMGIGLDWNFRRSGLKKINLECDVTGYSQHAGNTWPLKRGYGIYTALSVDFLSFRVKSSYWQCDRFISIFGNPLYGAVSMSSPDACFIRPKMVSSGAEYTRSFAPGFALGVDFNLYYRLAGHVNDPATGVSPVSAKINYDFGIYLRMNPSFLIKTALNH